MAECGYSPKDQLMTLRKLGSIYQGHPDVRFIPALEASTGSLGEGLSLGIGMALAAQARQEPDAHPMSCWATARFRKARSGKRPCPAASISVDNLVAIVDYNQIQLDGFVKDIMSLEPLADKWRGFGWHVIEVDGHDIAALQNAFAEASATKGKPTASSPTPSRARACRSWRTIRSFTAPRRRERSGEST